MTDNKNNSGHGNSGNCNSGNCNSGDYNSGNGNSGHGNSGSHNSGSRNSGCFNTTTAPKLFFNKPIADGIKVDIPYIFLPVTEWVNEKLVTLSYKEAWVKAWGKLDKQVKDRFLSLPNFDAKVFLEITGIDVGAKGKESCDGKVVVIDGEEYFLRKK